MVVPLPKAKDTKLNNMILECVRVYLDESKQQLERVQYLGKLWGVLLYFSMPLDWLAPLFPHSKSIEVS